MKDQLQPARGHVAKIIPFDDATILLPLGEREVWRLIQSLSRTMRALEESGDFPERSEYEQLKANLHTAHWMLTQS